MKPLTAQSAEGRVLLALRAGPMASGAIAERFGSTHYADKLVKAGYVERAPGDEGGELRITEAGRAACPYRNPLAAPGAVKPITTKEATMPRENLITRNDVLNVILSAGAHGITRPALVQHFDCAGAEARVDMHTSKLVRETPALVSRPRPGFFIAASHAAAPDGEQPVTHYVFGKVSPPSAADVRAQMEQLLSVAPPHAAQPGAGMAQGGMPLAAAVESIEITAPGNRRAPVVFEDIDIEFAVFSSGRVEISDERHTVVIKGSALKQLREFVGLIETLA